MSPVRIQRKRSNGWRMPPNTVYVGRPTKWGNPFTGADAVERYREYAATKPSAFFEPIRGKNLACWCPLDKPCHADVLLEIINEDVLGEGRGKMADRGLVKLE